MKVLVSWSTGKDSAWCLHRLRALPGVEVVGLLATITQAYGRVSMHGVRYALLEAQALAVGLPLVVVGLPSPCPNAAYEAAMEPAMIRARAEGVEAIAFGDLFLEEVRRYREERVGRMGMRALFPLWGHPTRALAEEMIGAGLRARLTCVDPRALPASFAGREFDYDFLRDLPPRVDPCGEHGEFHSFAWDGPMLLRPIGVYAGEVLLRDGFVFADLVPLGAAG